MSDELKKEDKNDLEECKKQAQEYLNNWKRERADFINYKKSEAERMGRLIEFGKMATIGDFLDIRDDLERALKSNELDERELNIGYRDGINMILSKFDELLKRYKVERIKTDGHFDPNVHEAVVMEPGGELLQEVKSGYTMNGEVIRPAQVKIINNK